MVLAARFAVALAVTLAAVLAGCSFDARVDATAQVLCARAADCTSGDACVAGECVPRGVRVPTALPLQLIVDEDGAAQITLAASGVDAAKVRFVVVDAPARGSLTCADGVVVCAGDGCAPASSCSVPAAGLVYRPAPNENGKDSFTFTAVPTAYPKLVSAPAAVDVTVTPVNDAPAATVPPAAAIFQGQTVGLALGGSDVDGDPLSLRIIAVSDGSLDAPLQQEIAMADGVDVVHYTARADFVGEADISYTVSDGVAESAPATAVVRVDPALRAIGPSSTVAVDEDGSVAVALSGQGGEDLSFVVTRPPLHGTVALASPTSARYAPAPDYNGPDAFSFAAVSDGQTSPPAVVQLDVLPVDDPPVCPPAAATVDEDGAGTIALSATDVDGDAVSFAFSGIPLALFSSVDVDGTTLTYQATPNAFGTEHIPLTCSDGVATVATELVVTVANTPDPPIALPQPGPVALDEDGEALVVLEGVDPDGDDLTFPITAQPAHGTVEPLLALADSAVVRYRPAPDYNGPDSFGFRAADGSGRQSNDAAVDLVVHPVNDPPVIDTTPLLVGEDEPIKVLTIVTHDVDGDDVTVGFSGEPQHALLQLGTTRSTLRYLRIGSTPFLDDTITVTASDGTATTTAAIPIEITSQASCALIQATHPSGVSSGVHVIDPGPPGGAGRFLAHCETVVGGGGWTLALRADGRNSKLKFTGSLWTVPDALNPNAPDPRNLLNADEPDYPGSNDDEVMLGSYVTVPVDEVLLGVSPFKVTGGADFPATRFVRAALAQPIASLWVGVKSGVPLPFDAASSSPVPWTSAVPGATVEAGCVEAGLNVSSAVVGARIGLLASPNGVCSSANSFVGVGNRVQPTAGGVDVPTGTSVPSFIAVWVRSRDFTSLGSQPSCDAHHAAGARLSGTYLVDGVPAACTFPFCGDGVIQAPETCDDGFNGTTDASCSPLCQAPRCGDGVVELSEQCDDGNAVENDGCSTTCVVTSS